MSLDALCCSGRLGTLAIEDIHPAVLSTCEEIYDFELDDKEYQILN